MVPTPAKEGEAAAGGPAAGTRAGTNAADDADLFTAVVGVDKGER